MLSCLPHLVISVGWQNHGCLPSSSFLLPLKKLLLGKKRPCVTTALDFSSKIWSFSCSWLRRQINVWVMQCHGGVWRGLTHPSQGWHNLNLLYSYNILKCIKCPKSRAVFLTIINSDHRGIQLLFLSVPILLAVEMGSWGICYKGMYLLIVEWPLRQFGSGRVTRQAPFLKPLASPFQTNTWDHDTVSYVQTSALGGCT